MTSRENDTTDAFTSLGEAQNLSDQQGIVTSTPRSEQGAFMGPDEPHRSRLQVVISDTTTEMDQNVEEPMTSLANNLSLLLQQFTTQVTRMNQRREKPIQSFAGQIHENPEAFMNYMNQYFRNNDIQDDTQKIEAFKNQLKDSARKWAQAFEGIPISYATLQESFLRRYNSTAEKSTAMSILFGEKQRPNESTEVFISKKRSLFARMAPETNEEAMTQIILDQLLPPVKSRLRGHPFQDVMELINHAVKAEQDAKEEDEYWASIHGKSQTTTRASNNPNIRQGPSSGTTTASKPPSPCRYCQGWHFHKDCHRYQPPGNFQRSPDQRGFSEDPRHQQPRSNPFRGGVNADIRSPPNRINNNTPRPRNQN